MEQEEQGGGVRPPVQNRNRTPRTADQKYRETARIIAEVQETFRSNGEEFEEGDEEQLVVNPAERSDFPYIIFLAAVAKDILDIPMELSFVGTVLTAASGFTAAG